MGASYFAVYYCPETNVYAVKSYLYAANYEGWVCVSEPSLLRANADKILVAIRAENDTATN